MEDMRFELEESQERDECGIFVRKLIFRVCVRYLVFIKIFLNRKKMM